MILSYFTSPMPGPSRLGGPPEYIQEYWSRLVGTAQHLAELRAGA